MAHVSTMHVRERAFMEQITCKFAPSQDGINSPQFPEGSSEAPTLQPEIDRKSQKSGNAHWTLDFVLLRPLRLTWLHPAQVSPNPSVPWKDAPPPPPMLLPPPCWCCLVLLVHSGMEASMSPMPPLLLLLHRRVHAVEWKVHATVATSITQWNGWQCMLHATVAAFHCSVEWKAACGPCPFA